MSAYIIQIFIQKRNVFFLKNFIAEFWKLFKKTNDSSWVNNLIAWTQSQIQKRWYRNAGQEIALTHCIRNIMHSFWRVSSAIKCLFWANYIYILSIVYNFANEGYILQWKNSKIFFIDQILTKNEISLHIKSSLTKNCANESTFFNERFYLGK